MVHFLLSSETKSYKCVFLYRNKMLKNWGVIGGIAAAVAAGVYVLWGPITDRKKKKKGKSPCNLKIMESAAGCTTVTWKWLLSFRHGSWPFELGQHLLPELSASGFGSMSVLHWMAGAVFTIAHDPVVQKQPAFHHIASAS